MTWFCEWDLDNIRGHVTCTKLYFDGESRCPWCHCLVLITVFTEAGVRDVIALYW